MYYIAKIYCKQQKITLKYSIKYTVKTTKNYIKNISKKQFFL